MTVAGNRSINGLMLRLQPLYAFLLALCITAAGAIHADELAAAPPSAEEAPPSAEQVEFFEKEVRPLLVRRCYSCHSSQAKSVRGGLLLDSRQGWQLGGDSGTAIRPGKPAESMLIDAVRYRGLEMPPSGRLPEAEILVLEKWISLGAPDPRTGQLENAETSESNRAPQHGTTHWSFQPIRQVTPPPVMDQSWPRTDVDRFVLARLESAGLQPVIDADRTTLARRIYFDLVGLPPSLEQLADFAADRSPLAVEHLVDRLLASHHFGETWGRHWLDVARYADTNGLDENFTFYDAWHYRNYVIRAWNADRPFDRFIAEQVAGDLLPFSCQEDRDENLTATGFLVLGPKVIGATDKRQLELDVIDEQSDTLGKALLGLTLGCARCHDHKFDPIPTRDYYALAGIFGSTETLHGNLLNRKDLSGWNLHPIGPDAEARHEQHLAHEKSIAELQGEQTRLKRKQRQLQTVSPQNRGVVGTDEESQKPSDGDELTRIAERLTRIAAELDELKKNPPERPPLVMSVNDRAEPGPTRVRVRGVATKEGDLVPRGFVSVVGPSGDPIDQDVSGRRELSDWLTSSDNPLPSRVAVNRIWHHLFGVGLVRTVDDFGTRGELPSHPELLDYLAVRFRQEGWSTKRLIRELMLSRVYQLASDHDPMNVAADPENRLLWRMNRRRLTVEAIRDGILAVSGQLDFSAAESVVADLKFQATGVGIKPRKPFVSLRRTVYLPVVRNDLPEIFQIFDFVDPQTVSGSRSRTTVATQSLYMMNSPQVSDAAELIAAQLMARDVKDSERIDHAFQQILGRPVSLDDASRAQKFLESLAAEGLADGAITAEDRLGKNANAWSMLCQALLSSTRFQYLD